MVEIMTSCRKFYFLFIYIVIITLIDGKYFQGGTISYKVVETYDSIVSISITQTYLYLNSVIRCSESKIHKKPLLLFRNSKRIERFGTLNCTRYCNQSDGFEPITMDTFCTDYSTALDITVGQRSDIINITDGSYFLIASQGNSWRSFNTLKKSMKAKYRSIPCLINLQIRSDGTYNNPPLSTMIFPIYIQVGIRHTIKIPFYDPDADEVRCRFTNDSDECGDACHLALPQGIELELEECTLEITGANAGDWYAVTIMVRNKLLLLCTYLNYHFSFCMKLSSDYFKKFFKITSTNFNL